MKIGYLAYTAYLEESHAKLDEVFTFFKNSGVSEVVLDLRYNLGGNAATPPYLGSFLAPQANVAAGDVFLKEVWNKNYMNYYVGSGKDLTVYLNKNNVANLNLSRVFILTTSRTASASEATISGLMPYLDVIKIGTKTLGKYCGAALVQPVIDDEGTIDPLIKNWLLSIIIYKFVNKNGFTDFKDGIAPEYVVEDDLFAAYPFGSVEDPHLAKAIAVITGRNPRAVKSTGKPVPEKGRDYIMRNDLTERLYRNYGNTRHILVNPND